MFLEVLGPLASIILSINIIGRLVYGTSDSDWGLVTNDW